MDENWGGEEPNIAAKGPGRRIELLEVSVFLFLFVPSMVISSFLLEPDDVGFLLLGVGTVLQDLSLVCLILFFLWRNGEPLRRLGWTAGNAWAEAALGVALFVPFFFGFSLLGSALEQAGLSAPPNPLPSILEAAGPARMFLAFLLLGVVAVAEETIFRGYLILRFRALNQGPALAVVLSAVAFALGHGYEGSAGMVTVWVMGLAFALIYLWRGSLVAPMVIHFLQDFVTVVVLPFIGGR